MKRSARAVVSALWLAACGGRVAAPVPEPVASPAPAASAAQPDYCARLQPLLTKAGSSARIGTELACLDVPGVTELGRYGPTTAGEEATLQHCFDDPAQYEKLWQRSEAEFDLDIAQEFTVDSGAGAELGLSLLVPWAPKIEVDRQRAKRVSAKVALGRARFVTLVGLASQLQGQRRERECLEALCQPDYTYVNKALVGVPRLELRAEDARGEGVGIGAGPVAAEFHTRALERGRSEITSSEPITLAVARSSFRTAQTERLCQFCGRRGQRCCEQGDACDGGLACSEGACVEAGGPDQPCDGDRCAAAAVCIQGRCRNACGRAGQPCCAGNACSGALRCKPDPENALEPIVTSERVTVDGGWLGTSEDRTFGSTSCGALRTRGRFAVTEVGAGRGECARAWWFDPRNERDCRVGVHFEVSSFGTIECRIDVLAAPVAKPDLCLP